jgi:hypothetical protein
MSNKQTSVQQFWDKIALKLSIDQINEFLPLVEKCKEMHKQEIMEAHTLGFIIGWGNGDEYDYKEYYNETFGGKDEQ